MATVAGCTQSAISRKQPLRTREIILAHRHEIEVGLCLFQSQGLCTACLPGAVEFEWDGFALLQHKNKASVDMAST